MQIPKVFIPERSKYLVLTTDYILPLLIIISVLFTIYALLYSELFNVVNISCKLDFEPCENSVVMAELDKLKGQNIIKLKTDRISQKLTSGDYTIREAIFTKSLPNNLSVDLHSVYPVVALKVQNLDTWIALDDKYRVIKERSTDPNVPTVIVIGPLTLALGKPIADPLLQDTLSMTRRLFEQLPSIKSVTLVDENRIDVLLDSGKTAVLTPKKDEAIQLRSLQAILQEVTISKGVRTIDVRFSQPVLR
jgi:hypothetical protein